MSTEYWKNREAGKRGQGEYPNTVVKVHTGVIRVGVDWPAKPVSKKAIIKNTKRARKAT